MLTAMGEDDDRILGLEAGADDYVAKPVVPRELVLRIQAILRRSHEPASGSVAAAATEIGSLKIEPAKSRARLGNQILPLTGAELRILESLVAASGQLVSRERLNEFALGRELSPYDRALDTHMSHLRRKLAAAASDESIQIISVRGAGYRLVID
jgi:DNA-binding response OmpR family regulator